MTQAQSSLEKEIQELKAQLKDRVLRTNVGAYKMRIGEHSPVYDYQGNSVGKHKIIYENKQCTISVTYIDNSYISPWERFNNTMRINVMEGTMKHYFKDGSIKVTETGETIIIPYGTEIRWECIEFTQTITIFEPPL